jgi:hypothetical protein
LLGFLIVVFAITAERRVLTSTEIEYVPEDRDATGELERLPAPLSGVLPDLPIARDGAHEACITYTRFGDQLQLTKRATCRTGIANKMFLTGQRRGFLKRKSGIRAHKRAR